MPAEARELPDYWVCPECGRKFVRESQGHVHGTWTVEEHLVGQPDTSHAVYDRFVAQLRELGPFEFAPTKRQIGFQVYRIFSGVRLTERGLEGYLDIARRVESDRFRHVAPYTKRLFVHHFVLRSEDDLDEEFAGWMREAYEVGWGA